MQARTCRTARPGLSPSATCSTDLNVTGMDRSSIARVAIGTITSSAAARALTVARPSAGRAVEDDVIDGEFELVDRAAKPQFGADFGGHVFVHAGELVGLGHHPEPFDAGLDGGGGEGVLAQQDAEYVGGGGLDAQVDGGGALPVEADDQHPPAKVGEGCGQVDRARGLAEAAFVTGQGADARAGMAGGCRHSTAFRVGQVLPP